MKQFLKAVFYFSLIASIPVVIILGSYAYFDPFRVLYKYDDYSNSPTNLNRDYVSTETYINKKDKYHYNSFILGSSRTTAYRAKSWQKHLLPTDRIFFFDAYSENIYGIYIKLKYLDETKAPIDNVLLIICREQTFARTDNAFGHMFMKDPKTSHESEFAFQISSLKSYINPIFLFNYFYYQATHQYKEFMFGSIQEGKLLVYDKVNNSLDDELDYKENLIHKDSLKYYEERKREFYHRSGERIDSAQIINPRGAYLINQIAGILKKHNTKYKVVISPLYEQKKLIAADMKILQNAFGNHLYDFSGKNKITDNISNYYENSHYRPKVGDSIMNYIYK